ncbi:hypothetical protein ACFZBE_39995 [Streptomyces sp. NPDC008061]|uniref:hypothetical protein n=1 Tax=Streptomyces sp. NPDC008061 TaxID=3364805 RepID=UPI0036E86D47
MREIGHRVGRSSTGSVAYQLGRLEKLGLISRNGRHWRSCRLTGYGADGLFQHGGSCAILIAVCARLQGITAVLRAVGPARRVVRAAFLGRCRFR